MTMPSHNTNDIIFLSVEDANQAVVLGTPAAFSEVTNSPQGQGTVPGDASSTRNTLFWSRATNAQQGAPTITDPGDHATAKFVTFSGCTTVGVPWDGTPLGRTSNATINYLSSTTNHATNGNDRLIVHFVANQLASASQVLVSNWSNPILTNFSAWTNFQQSVHGNGGGFDIATGEKAIAGTYPSSMASTAGAGGVVQAWMTLALIPSQFSTYATTGWAGGMGVHVPRAFSQRVRGDVWVEPGDQVATDPDLDTWEGEAT